jgi:hypothetical protein
MCHGDPAVLKRIVTTIMSKSSNQYVSGSIRADMILSIIDFFYPRFMLIEFAIALAWRK